MIAGDSGDNQVCGIVIGGDDVQFAVVGIRQGSNGFERSLFKRIRAM